MTSAFRNVKYFDDDLPSVCSSELHRNGMLINLLTTNSCLIIKEEISFFWIRGNAYDNKREKTKNQNEMSMYPCYQYLKKQLCRIKKQIKNK